MNAPRKSWWQRWRFIAPALALLLLAVSFGIALVRSDTSQVIVYNHTGTNLGPLTVWACGQQFLFPRVPNETSVHIRLRNNDSGSGVELSTPTGHWHWTGSYLESHGGYLVFVHLHRGMEVETSTQVSIWQQLLFGRTAGR